LFYERLRAACKISKTTATTVTKELNLSSGNVGRWKAGGVPSIEILIKLSERLNVSTDFLLGKDNNILPSNAIPYESFEMTPVPIVNKIFYERLKDACKNSNTTATAVTLELGLSRGNLSRWKAGGVPSIEVLIKFSERLNVSTDFLLGKDNNKLPSKAIPYDSFEMTPVPIVDKIFYERLKEVCKNSNTTATAVTLELGLSRGNLGRWKTGTIPNGAILSKLSERLNVSVDYLLGITDIKKPLIKGDEELTEYLNELESREELRMLFRLTSKATKEDVEKSVRVIEAMLKDAEIKD